MYEAGWVLKFGRFSGLIELFIVFRFGGSGEDCLPGLAVYSSEFGLSSLTL